VLKSPFAQVLQSNSCSVVAIVSPLKALERKWCTFEFSFASVLKKQVLMLTEDGVLQEGHVTPKALHDLAMKLVYFDCREASCTDPGDSKLIDDAVRGMGGYEVLTGDLLSVFDDAITAAHDHTDEALELIRNKRSETPSLPQGVERDFLGQCVALRSLTSTWRHRPRPKHLALLT